MKRLATCHIHAKLTTVLDNNCYSPAAGLRAFAIAIFHVTVSHDSDAQ
jgi:hypothetical protein